MKMETNTDMINRSALQDIMAVVTKLRPNTCTLNQAHIMNLYVLQIYKTRRLPYSPD